MSDQAVSVAFNGDNFFQLSHEIANSHKDQERWGPHAYDVILSLMFRAAREALSYADRLGWEGTRYSFGHCLNKSPTDKEKAKAADKPYELGSLSFVRVGEGPSRTFTIKIMSDMTCVAKI